VQLLAELVSNLANEQLHLDAWLDLAPEKQQRLVAAGLVSSLEQAAVLLAGALNDQQQQLAAKLANSEPSGKLAGQQELVKATENVLLAIRSVSVPLAPQQQQQQQQQTEASLSQFNCSPTSFPSAASTLGTRWMNSEQKFSLNLQATHAPAHQLPAQQDNAGQTLEGGQQIPQMGECRLFGSYSLQASLFGTFSMEVSPNKLPPATFSAPFSGPLQPPSGGSAPSGCSPAGQRRSLAPKSRWRPSLAAWDQLETISST